jgi:hypothetical protein
MPRSSPARSGSVEPPRLAESLLNVVLREGRLGAVKILYHRVDKRRNDEIRRHARQLRPVRPKPGILRRLAAR